MSRGFEIYIEYARKIGQILENPREILERIKGEVLREIPGAKIYLFGSIARGRYTAASDIDVLVVAEGLEAVKVDELKARIKGQYPWLPLELHIIDRRIYESWYRRFIREHELIEI